MTDLTEADVKEMLSLLRELVKWSKFESVPKLRTVLEQNLPTDKEKVTYEFSDGQRSTRDIAKIVGVSHQTVSNYWERWGKLRIVDKSDTREGRSRRICSLGDVGLEVPETKNVEIPPRPENQEGETNVTGQ